MRSPLFAAMIAWAGCASGPEAPAPPPAEGDGRAEAGAAERAAVEGDAAAIDLDMRGDARVYRDGAGLRVTIAPIDADGAEEALIEIRRPGHDLDGLVLRYERVRQSRDYSAYRTTLRGDDFHAVRWRPREAAESAYAYLPGEPGRGGIPVDFDEAAAADADPSDLARRHEEMARAGTLAEIRALDRADREARHEARFQERIAGDLEACGRPARAAIEWSSISDEELLDRSVWRYCLAVGRGIGQICAHPRGRAAFRERVDAVRCAFGDEARVDIDDGVLTWVADPGRANPRDVAADLLREELDRDRVVLGMEGREGAYLSLDPGDADEPVYMSEDGRAFFEHREPRRGGGATARDLFAAGRDAHLAYDGDGAWTISCGDAEASAREVPAEEARAILRSAEWRGPAWEREPYALARDDRGRYFFVDRMLDRYGGAGFRVFIGLRGDLELTALRDIARDSAGTVFATQQGDLRLVVDEGESRGATWIRDEAGREEEELTLLSVRESSRLIYRELGVYRGETFGTVCEAM